MQSFVTPTGVVRVAHIWCPFGMPFGPIWYRDLTFEISCSDVAANDRLTGLWRVGVLSTPTILRIPVILNAHSVRS